MTTFRPVVVLTRRADTLTDLWLLTSQTIKEMAVLFLRILCIRTITVGFFYERWLCFGVLVYDYKLLLVARQVALRPFCGFHDTHLISFDSFSNISNNPGLISSHIPKASFTVQQCKLMYSDCERYITLRPLCDQ